MVRWPEASARPWLQPHPPARVLALRFHALGDIAITLPYLQAFHQSYGEPAIDLLTRDEFGQLPRSLAVFRRVYELRGGRRFKPQLAHALLLAPRLMVERYDVVLDLQNNEISRTIRSLVRPRAWSTFERRPLGHAAERTRSAIAEAGFPLSRVPATLRVKASDAALDILRDAGWNPGCELIVFSPAGAFSTRHWPVEHYATFARLWRSRRPAQIAILGAPSLRDRAAAIDAAMAGDVLNLAGRTTIAEALAILQRARLVVSEDCGLMHMAWVSGIPTLALFGSSRHDQAAPRGSHTTCLHSGDLACGACMDAECRFGDVRCLTRYAPELVVAHAEALLARVPGERVCDPVPE